MITVATLLWQSNAHSLPTSCCYDETWAEKLYRGFARNLTQPFRFVVFTDRPRRFGIPIEQRAIREDPPTYACCLEPYRMDVPMILVGLDTIVTGNIDHLATYCLTADKVAVPRDPIFTDTVCDGVHLVPAGFAHWYEEAAGENDMEFIRSRKDQVNVIDDMWPGHVRSYRCDIKTKGFGDTRIAYFHGAEKAHEIVDREPWVRRHWQ
jgi:hypothetical protein